MNFYYLSGSVFLPMMLWGTQYIYVLRYRAN